MTELVLRERLGADRPESAGTPFVNRRSPSHVSTPARPPVELSLVTTRSEFEALETDWNALYAEAGRPAQVFLTFNWCWHWTRHYLGDGRSGPSLAIVTARSRGRLVLVMPLVSQRAAGLCELAWLGAPVTQYGDVLAAPAGEDLSVLIEAWQLAVRKTGADVANLRRVRADAVAMPLLQHLGAAVTAVEEAPYLALAQDTSFAGWEQRRKPKAIKNRRRQARRLAETGEIAFVGETNTEQAGALAAHAVRLKRGTLSEKGKLAPSLADSRFEAFFADAARGLGRPAGVTVVCLTTDGVPAALKIVIESNDAAFLHVAVFEPRFEKCGAGALLLEHLVDRTIRSGRATLDLLPPRHEYKMDFGDGVVAVSDFAKPLSTTGWLYTQGYLRLRRRLKAIVEAMPQPVRKAIARLAAGR